MPSPRIHGQIDEVIFGKSYFEEVHKWIDGTFNGKNGRTHWVNRHYVQAILEKFNPENFPDKKRREREIVVAKLHVMFDWAFYYHRIYLPFTREQVILELNAQGIDVESELCE